MTVIGRGAEAVLTRTATGVQKHRIEKTYRHPVLDKKLRQFRTRREAKVLQTLARIDFPGPELMLVDDKNMVLEMSFVEGKVLKDALETNPARYGGEVGMGVGRLHANNVIHADLTTSNMILKNDGVHFIDFGLTFFSEKPEDMAVDINLLDKAIESKHNSVHKEFMDAFIAEYKKTHQGHESVLKRLEKVRARGRNKTK